MANAPSLDPVGGDGKTPRGEAGKVVFDLTLVGARRTRGFFDLAVQHRAEGPPGRDGLASGHCADLGGRLLEVAGHHQVFECGFGRLGLPAFGVARVEAPARKRAAFKIEAVALAGDQ